MEKIITITPEMADAFLVARETQTDYWRALLALETLIGAEVDGLLDLRDTTLEEVVRMRDTDDLDFGPSGSARRKEPPPGSRPCERL